MTDPCQTGRGGPQLMMLLTSNDQRPFRVAETSVPDWAHCRVQCARARRGRRLAAVRCAGPDFI
jgi:hypothetical protein